MSDFLLTLIAPDRYGVETFDSDPDVWTATDAARTTVSRNTGESYPRDSVMSIQGVCWDLGDGVDLGDGYYLGDSPIGKGEGAYKDFSVEEGVIYNLSCLFKVVTGYLTIRLYDQTNATEIKALNKGISDWLAEEISVEVPSGCSTLRVQFFQKSDNQRPGPFYIDNVSLNGNLLISDPDRYERIPERVGSFHQTLSGGRVYDYRCIHYRLHLGWDSCSKDQYENLREAYYSSELLYFDDGAVPPMTEEETIYDNPTFNYVGITLPSSTHKAYYDSSTSLPGGKNDFESNEFSTADYQAIDEDDDNYKETSNPTADNYLYHKFLLLSSLDSADVQRIRIKVVMSGNDSSPQDIDGGVLYAWNGTNWVELARVTSSAKSEMTYSVLDHEYASQLIDTSDNYIRLLLRSRNRRNGSSGLNLRTYYVECELNEGLNLEVELSHKAILDGDGDMIWVKNITQGTTLTLNTDYTISDDRRSVMVTGQNQGDLIQVRYNRHFEVSFSSIPEEWLPGGSPGEKERRVEVTLQTLSESK